MRIRKINEVHINSYQFIPIHMQVRTTAARLPKLQQQWQMDFSILALNAFPSCWQHMQKTILGCIQRTPTE
eukprot:scaffold127311_cov25-Tisochrysis_lutea.AAC.2